MHWGSDRFSASGDDVMAFFHAVVRISIVLCGTLYVQLSTVIFLRCAIRSLSTVILCT